MTNDASDGNGESTSTGSRPTMTASRLRDLVAGCLTQHRDVSDVAFTKSAFNDRLGMNVTAKDRTVWRIHFLRDSWARPGGDQ